MVDSAICLAFLIVLGPLLGAIVAALAILLAQYLLRGVIITEGMGSIFALLLFTTGLLVENMRELRSVLFE